jgi:hypothetical protein
VLCYRRAMSFSSRSFAGMLTIQTFHKTVIVPVHDEIVAAFQATSNPLFLKPGTGVVLQAL